LSSVGSRLAFLGVVVVEVLVVVVAVSVDVVQPTRATRLTAAITGINFFILLLYQNAAFLSRRSSS
jgi:hypothetical protein